MVFISHILPNIEQIAREAGQIALRDFQPGLTTLATIKTKAGGSPVTSADLAVDAYLKNALEKLHPQAAWMSEETADNSERLSSDLVWVVDPIDGTRAFLTGKADWSISIALVDRGRPVLGVIYSPPYQAMFTAIKAQGVYLNKVALKVSSQYQLENARVIGPQAMVDDLQKRTFSVTMLARIPSLALRLARLAEGQADLALVSPHACDWDLAAADLMIQEAGGILSSFYGRIPIYNRSSVTHDALYAAPSGLHHFLRDIMQEWSEHRKALLLERNPV